MLLINFFRIVGFAAAIALQVCFVTLVSPSQAIAEEIPEPQLAQRFESRVHSILASHCTECHSDTTAEADIDLTSFQSLTDVKQHLEVWQKVAEMLASEQMPPKDAKQLNESDSRELRQWVQSLLKVEARRSAGDPGPVVLRRLNNAEYTFVLRDLTRVASLDPAAEFPVDGAAGEGFTNAGNALSMSPALFSKYLDAGKAVASHAVLLPSGIEFSPFTTRRDWTEERLSAIRNLYAKYSAKTGETQVNLQGIVFDTNGGGRLPIEEYLRATLEEREALANGTRTIDEVAQQRQLSAKYLGLLWNVLGSDQPTTQLLTALRNRWRVATPETAPELIQHIAQWQQALWRFSSVGHIGKVNGPKAWMESIDPLVTRQELRLKLPAASTNETVSIYLVTGDAGDGSEEDFALWERPRLVAPGRPDLLLKDVRRVATALAQHREATFRVAAQALAAAAAASSVNTPINLEELAKQHQVPVPALRAWLDYLGIAAQGPVKIANPLTRTMTSGAGYDFIKGWVGDDALSIVANSSDNAVRIPGNMKPHSIAVHPSPTIQVAVGWQSPLATTVRIAGSVQHAHPECGNGVSWGLELRRGNTRQRLAAGNAQGGGVVNFGPFESIAVQPGDLVSLIISPRDANHSCDLTAIEFSLTSDQQTSDQQTWDLAQDVSPDILAGNPHADQYGNKSVWHFYGEPTAGGSEHVIPSGSLVGKWQASSDNAERKLLADQLQSLLLTGPAKLPADSPDLTLYQQLTSLSGPLLSAALQAVAAQASDVDLAGDFNLTNSNIGLDPALFGKHPDGSSIEADSLCVKAPAVLEVQLPADIVAGSEFVVAGTLHPSAGKEASVQFEVLSEKPTSAAGLQAIAVTEGVKSGAWTSNNRTVSMASPIVVQADSSAKQRLTTAFDEFRSLFPAALCYTKIVPVDEVVTLTLYYREDDQLMRLMLSDAENTRLDQLWDELHFISQDAFLSVDAYEQLWQYATQDADPSAFEPLREPLKQQAAKFREQLVSAEPKHVEAVLQFAEQAFRRSLSASERAGLQSLYNKLRSDELAHEDAIRLLLARILVSPAFLYRTETGDGPIATQNEIKTRQLTDQELATRLSFFLWSTVPDERLKQLASENQLRNGESLRNEMRRMVQDDRTRRLATEFACQWLHIYEFDLHDEKSETAFPTFNDLRGPMYEESIRFFTDWFQRDGSLLELIDTDYTFVNEALAKHYGIEGVKGEGWHRVAGAQAAGRGGILTMATTLSKQAGASRTSPILRGNWISEVVMGEKLPRPPKNVPVLPDSVPVGLAERQLIEQHSSDPACAKCHARIDPFGFSLEGFDAIGRARTGPEIDTLAALADGTEIAGLRGLKDYLLNQRRHDFVRQFCKKILGYALGRAVQLSDEELLTEMQEKLAANGYRVSVAMEAVITSPQFQRIRAE